MANNGTSCQVQTCEVGKGLKGTELHLCPAGGRSRLGQLPGLQLTPKSTGGTDRPSGC